MYNVSTTGFFVEFEVELPQETAVNKNKTVNDEININFFIIIRF